MTDENKGLTNRHMQLQRVRNCPFMLIIVNHLFPAQIDLSELKR